MWRLIIAFLLSASSAQAELQSLFKSSNLAARPAANLLAVSRANMLKPLPRLTQAEPAAVCLSGSSKTAQLLSLIALAEAGPLGYDAVQYGARVKPPKRPTQMTLAEILAWVKATPGQPHAIGRYQFIPQTLRRAAREAGLSLTARFSPQAQDAMAHVLLQDAGLNSFVTGKLPRKNFMKNLARIWAGLPLPNGKSYYEGYAGNAASMSWATFEGGMKRIWDG